MPSLLSAAVLPARFIPAIDAIEQDDPVIALAERLMRLYDAHGEALTAFNPCEELMIRWRKNIQERTSGRNGQPSF